MCCFSRAAHGQSKSPYGVNSRGYGSGSSVLRGTPGSGAWRSSRSNSSSGSFARIGALVACSVRLRTLVTRQYDVLRAVIRSSFRVERGEAVGYVGPNGAGEVDHHQGADWYWFRRRGCVRRWSRAASRADRARSGHGGGIRSRPSSGGTYRSPNHSSCSDASTASRRRGFANLEFCSHRRASENSHLPVRQLSLGQECAPSSRLPCFTTPRCWSGRTDHRSRRDGEGPRPSFLNRPTSSARPTTH